MEEPQEQSTVKRPTQANFAAPLQRRSGEIPMRHSQSCTFSYVLPGKFRQAQGRPKPARPPSASMVMSNLNLLRLWHAFHFPL
jgi:hypothetical protein